jgi:hypothetical protein
MATERACLLIADISGYTGYLAGVELDHAQDVLADLMGTIVDGLQPSFILAKLEGDAAFTFAITDRIDGSLLLDTIERCYFRFRRRRRDVRQATTCACNACVRIPDLNLKFVAHHGTILRQRVADREELLGADVILAHRLLKNDVVAATGIEAYALFSQACVDAMDLDVAALGMQPASETYEHIGEVGLWLHDLERRWEEEQVRTRVMVDDETEFYSVSIPTQAPPQLAWEFATTPGRRLTWTPGVTAVDVTATGNRRGVGATNHCRHGTSTSVEEILDWRPYDYFTIRNTVPTPLGPLRFLQTSSFEATPEGTIVRLRIAAPASLRERTMLRAMRRMLDGSLREAGAMLASQLEAEMDGRRPASNPVPSSPAPA